jgi:hypothetical protein
VVQAGWARRKAPAETRASLGETALAKTTGAMRRSFFFIEANFGLKPQHRRAPRKAELRAQAEAAFLAWRERQKSKEVLLSTGLR